MRGLAEKLVKNSIFMFLSSYILVLVLPLLILTIGFQVAFNLVEENLKVTHINMLQRNADIIENEMTDIESVALQIASDSTVLELASMKKDDRNYISTALNVLENFTLNVNYKEIGLMDSKKAYVYFRSTDLVLYEKSYYRPEIFRTYLEKWDIDYNAWREEMDHADTLVPAFRRNGDGIEFVFPFSKQLFGEKLGVIVFHIDGDTIAGNMMFLDEPGADGRYMTGILDAEGDYLWSSRSPEEFPALTPEEMESSYLEKDGLSIIVAKSGKQDLYYVQILPVKENLADLIALKNLILLLLLAAIAVGVLMAVFQAVRKGKPVDEAMQALALVGEEPVQYMKLGSAVLGIVRKHEHVLREVEQSKDTLKKGFFNDLLKAEFSTEAQLEGMAETAGVDIVNRIYQIAYIQLFAGNDFSTVDEQTLDEIRVLFQLIKTRLRTGCGNNVWFHKKDYNSLIAIFAIDDLEEDVPDIIEQVRKWILEESHVELISGIGGTCNRLLLIWRSMEEARIALENTARDMPVLCYREEMEKRDEYYFPEIAEEKLKTGVRSGQWQETKDILTLLESANCDSRRLRRPQLLKLNQRFMDVLGEALNREEVQEDILRINEILLQPEIPEREYFQRLRHLYRRACNINVRQKQEQKSRMVEEMKEYIRAHFCESDMGLARVGSEFRVSESYLSALFKEQSGENFGDFLEYLRIEKACALLQDKSITVSEVAEETGYNSVQSFRRAFKRVKGVSPRELR